jgi:hypothetical protein
MTIIYTKITTPLNNQIIEANLGDGHLMFIPEDPANSDYQAYLLSLETNQ